jgi:hypothetical protein
MDLSVAVLTFAEFAVIPRGMSEKPTHWFHRASGLAMGVSDDDAVQVELCRATPDASPKFVG